MSSAIVSRGSKLYSNNEILSILNTADFWLDMADSNYYTLRSGAPTRLNAVLDKSKNPKVISITNNISFDLMRGLIRPFVTTGSDYLRVTMSTPTGSGFSETIIVVGYINAGTGGAILGGSSGTANSGGRILRISSTGAFYGRIGSGLAATTSGIDIGKMFVLSVVCFNGVATFYYNGVFNGSTAITAPTLLETTQDILRGNGATYVMRGGIGELLIFNSAVPTAQIQQIEYYLVNKWKIDTSVVISSPLSISGGVDLWLDGNDESTLTFSSGTSVSQWNDKSGNNRHATQGTASRQPTYNSTTKALAYSNANSSSLSSTCPYSTSETIFAVVNVPTASVLGTIVGSTNSARGREFRGGTNRGRITNNGTIIFTSFNVTLADSEKHLISFISDASNTYSTEMNINYIQDTDRTFIGFSAGSFTNLIGGSFSATGSFDSNIYEIIICNRVLPYADRISITKYLYNKWNLVKTPVLTSKHPYVSLPPFTRSFNPLDFDNCVLWLDAADTATITLSGSSVTQWSDKSGNGNHASTFVASPTYSNNAVNFSGSQGLSTSLTASSTRESGFFVIGYSTAVSGTAVGANPTGGRQFRAGTTILQTLRQDTTSILATTNTTTLTTNTRYLQGYTNNGTTLSHFLNGTFQGSGATGALTASTFTTIGLRAGAAEGLTGYIHELILFSRGLGATERLQVESYLAQKWGLVSSLNSITHPGRDISYKSLNPLTLGTCALWLDGYDPNGTGVFPSVGATVSTWVDKSGNGKNLTASGTPTYLTGGGINFNGTNAYYTNTNFAYNLSTRSVFVVAKVNTYVIYAGLITFIPNPSNQPDQNAITGMSVEFDTSSSLNFNQYLGGPAPTYFSQMPATITNINLYNDNMNTTVGSGYVNGNLMTSVTTATTAGTTSGFGVGGRWQSGVVNNLFTGNVYEVLLYNGPLTTTQRQQIEGYLAWKWGLVGNLPGPVHIGRLYRSLLPPFDPRQVSGCTLWLDGADSTSVVLSSSDITQWNDKSGNAFNALKNPSFTTATYTTKVNGVNVVSFPTLSQMDIANMTIPNQAKSIFYVVRTSGNLISSTSVDRFCMPITCTTNDSLESYFYGGTTSPPYTFASIARRGVSDIYTFQLSTFNPTSLFIMSAVVGTSNTVNTGLINGSTSGLTTTYNIAASGFVTTAVTHLIGNAIYTTAWDLGEIIVFNTNVSTRDRQRIEGYLAHKWGLTANLPSTHPYKKIRP